MKPHIKRYGGYWFVWRYYPATLSYSGVGIGQSIIAAWRDYEIKNRIWPAASLSRCPQG